MRALVCGLVLGCLLGAPSARAAAEQVEGPLPPTDVTAAKIHYEAGRRLYEAKRYREALTEFDAAFQASGRAALLYNIGRCHEQLGDEKEAIRAYEDFLAEEPNNPDRANVERHVQALRERVWSLEQGQAAPKVAVPPTDAPRHMRKYPFIIGGVALGIFAATIGTGVSALQHRNALDGQCVDMLCPAAAVDTRDSGQRLAIATDALIGVGSAVALASIITIAIEARRAAR